MRIKLGLICLLAFLVSISSLGFGQDNAPDQREANATQSVKKHKHSQSSPGREAAKGGEDIGKGVGKGAASAGKGVGGAAADLATLHPVDAGASLGKGAADAGKDIGVGSVKGTGKIGKGLGRGIGKLGKKAVGRGGKRKDQK